jgi:TatD DNase family protein
MRLYDAHNHLQDERLGPFSEDIRKRCADVACMVVNGSCESDWPAVLQLARTRPNVLASFGYHPWYVSERSPDWIPTLLRCLDAVPSGVGEIGLDRWIPGYDIEDQTEVFRAQMRIAADRNLPTTIHCLKAWGLIESLLREGPRPDCGFILHSYGGPAEMVEPLAALGAYFSLPGAFSHERKQRHQAMFRRVPLERLLIETDAPDQCLPEGRDLFQLKEEATGKRLNHPANLEVVYGFAADLLGVSQAALATQVETNFLRLFGALRTSPSGPGNPEDPG